MRNRRHRRRPNMPIRRAVPNTQFAAARERQPVAVTRSGPLFRDQAIDAMAEMLGVQPDPDEVLQRLSKPRAALRVLLYDPEIAAAIETRREAVISTPWRLEPGEGQEAEFLTEELKPHIIPLLRGAWGAVPFGYSVMEVVYTRRPDGKIGLGRVVEKPFEWFLPQQDGTVRWLPPDGSGGQQGVEVLPAKFLLTRRGGNYTNPYGDALLSRVYWPWYGATQNIKFWLQFLERFGQPLLVGTTQGDREQLAGALSRAVQDAAIAVDDGTTVQAIAPGNGGEAFDRFGAAMAKNIQKVILGQTLTTDVDGKGSYAAARVHNDVREDRRNADLRMVTATAQKLVALLLALNFPTAVPGSVEFVMEDAQGLEGDRAARDKTLREAVPELRFTEAYLTDTYGLDREHFTMEEEEEEQPPQQLPQPTGQQPQEEEQPPPKPPPGAKATAQAIGDAIIHAFVAAKLAAPKFDAGQQAVEDLADTALAAAIDGPIPHDQILAAIKAAADPNDLADRLARLVGDDADGGVFRAIVERAVFAADLIGYEAARGEVQG